QMCPEIAEVHVHSDLFGICSDDGVDLSMDGVDPADGWACWHRDEDPVNAFGAVLMPNREAFEKTERARGARRSLWRLGVGEGPTLGVDGTDKEKFDGEDSIFEEKPVALDIEDGTGKEKYEGEGSIFEVKPVALGFDSDVKNMVKHTLGECCRLEDEGGARAAFMCWLMDQPEFEGLGIASCAIAG
ncbi:unnamed protein product, partial [Prorocentrum cordatum]